jgi:hypothetical protein
MFFGQVGEHEVLIILIAVAFLVVGVPTMGVLAAKLGSGARDKIKRWLNSPRG